MVGPSPPCLCDLSLSSLKIGGWSCPGFSHIPPGLAFDKFTNKTAEEVMARDAARGLSVWAVSLWKVREKAQQR